MSNPAQDEFDAIIARNAARNSHHPEDRSDDEPNHSDASVSHSRRTANTHSLRNGRTRPAAADLDSDDDEDDWDGDGPSFNSYSAFTQKNGDRVNLPKSGRIGGGNTGPKGVIADAWAAEREKRGHNITRNERGDAVVTQEPTIISASQHPVRRGHVGAPPRHTEEEEDDLDGLDEDEDGDDEYVRKWRDLRIREMKGGANKRRYGSVETVDAMGFLEVVEETDGQTVVCVYIFDDELPISKAYLDHLHTIASKYSNVRFIALHYEEAEMEHAGVPAILAYRGGEKFTDIVPLTDEVPFTCNVVTNLEGALRSHVII